MAADGSHGPKPWTQRRASTIFLRVPTAEWINVRDGRKREFRASPRAVSKLWNVQPPCAVVAYRHHSAYGYQSKLMVLERTWEEPLGSISPESLEAEGFRTFADFRGYWVSREKTRFRPTRMIQVYVVRPFEQADVTDLGRSLFHRLYGEFL